MNKMRKSYSEATEQKNDTEKISAEDLLLIVPHHPDPHSSGIRQDLPKFTPVLTPDNNNGKISSFHKK